MEKFQSISKGMSNEDTSSEIHTRKKKKHDCIIIQLIFDDKVDSKNNRTVSEYDRPNDEGTMKLRNQFNQFDFRVRAVFLVGQTGDNETQAKIVDESRLHDDVIQESFLDSYNNLTLKTIMMLKWVTSNCIGKGWYLLSKA